jgi:hypothetical protein
LLKNLVKVISGTDSFNDLQWYMADVQGEWFSQILRLLAGSKHIHM